MQRDDHIRLQHMLDAANEAVFFASGKSRQDLAHDRMLALSIVKSIEIIGEAASKVSQEKGHSIMLFRGPLLLPCATGLFMFILT